VARSRERGPSDRRRGDLHTLTVVDHGCECGLHPRARVIGSSSITRDRARGRARPGERCLVFQAKAQSRPKTLANRRSSVGARTHMFAGEQPVARRDVDATILAAPPTRRASRNRTPGHVSMARSTRPMLRFQNAILGGRAAPIACVMATRWHTASTCVRTALHALIVDQRHRFQFDELGLAAYAPAHR